ncbi:unnamed protein product [Pieris macdunnoughi]|uniref:Uncharacterized protein n=1 Tax=Pieris macdunnoughi TaxID=345717 RepID=A0A821TXR4_9NEOP|nr:unnamed protein product [Pieris macdunnoughi]
MLTLAVHLSAALIENVTVSENISNDIKEVETRRKRDKHRELSTSSSEGFRKSDGSSKDEHESLDISPSSTSSSEKKEPSQIVQRTERMLYFYLNCYRRKWHRKCTPCPEDMVKKWKNPSIQWICGAYQRARRTFKSLCMMHYRNCQDGTMFVKIHDNRCANDTGRDQPYNIHFFYDYNVKSRSSKSSDSTIESSISV